MKPPDETRNGGPVSRTADHTEPTAKSADECNKSVNRLGQRARFYFNRFQSTGNHLDIHRATAAQLDLVGILEARRP